MKLCSGCWKSKPPADYGPDATNNDGLRSACRRCTTDREIIRKANRKDPALATLYRATLLRDREIQRELFLLPADFKSVRAERVAALCEKYGGQR